MPEDLHNIASAAMAGSLSLEETRAATYRAVFADTKGYGPSLCPTKPHQAPRPIQDYDEADEMFTERVKDWEAQYKRQVKAWEGFCQDIKVNNRSRLDFALEAYAWAVSCREWELAHQIGGLLVTSYGQRLPDEDRRLASAYGGF